MPYCRIASRILTVPGMVALAAGGWCGSAVSLAHAFPFDQAPSLARGVILVQETTPPAAPGDARAPFKELNEALAAARAKLEELTTAAEVATIAAELRKELQAARAENERLSGELEQVRAARQAAEQQAQKAAAEFAARERAMSERVAKDVARLRAVEQAAADAERLRQQLEQSEGKVAAAERARQQAEARMAEMQEVVESALEEAARLGQELAQAEERLTAVNTSLADMRKEREEAQRAADSLRGESERLRQQLAEARTRLEEVESTNAGMEEQLALLREAASSATDAARANLLAVEDKIRLLNEALSDLQPALEQEDEIAPDAGPPAGNDQGGRGPQTSNTREPPADAAGPGPEPAPSAAQGEETRTYELSAVRSANATVPENLDDAVLEDTAVAAEAVGQAKDGAGEERPLTLAQLTAALPLEERVQTQNLLADLKAKTTDAGLLMTVPGEDLFTVNSEQIEDSAHETLAKVAEVISIYKDQKVVITGHTDALGDPTYNQQLSERRADLVRQFFIDNFDVDDARLQTVGAGEERPIASNATTAGRRANRRVEVLVMN